MSSRRLRAFVYSDHAIKPSPSPPLCWQMHRGLTVPVPTLRLWDSLSEGIGRVVASPPFLVGYVRWDARSNQESPPCQTVVSTALQLAAEHKGIPAALEKRARVKSCSRGSRGKADPLYSGGRPMTRRKKQACALRETAVARGQASGERFSEITSGTSRRQQGLMTTCEDSLNEAVWPKERRAGRGWTHESVEATTEE